MLLVLLADLINQLTVLLNCVISLDQVMENQQKNKPAIPPRYAHLVIGSTYTAVTFLLETYDYVFQNKRQS